MSPSFKEFHVGNKTNTRETNIHKLRQRVEDKEEEAHLRHNGVSWTVVGLWPFPAPMLTHRSQSHTINLPPYSPAWLATKFY